MIGLHKYERVIEREAMGTWDIIIIFLYIILCLFLFNGCKGKAVIFIKIQHKSLLIFVRNIYFGFMVGVKMKNKGPIYK